MRIPLAVGIQSRAGALTKDRKTVNGLIEPDGERRKLRKRPGLAQSSLMKVGVAQLLTYWDDRIIAVVDDHVCGSDSVVGSVTWNGNDKGSNITLANGNLTASAAGSVSGIVRSTARATAGQWYMEVTIGATNNCDVGMANSSATLANDLGNVGSNGIAYRQSGDIIKNNAVVSTAPASFTTADVIGVFYDAAADTIEFYKNNTLQYTATGSDVPTGELYMAVGAVALSATAPSMTANFGASAFTYSHPTSPSATLVLTQTNLNPTTADLQMSSQDNGQNAPTPYLMVKNRQQAWTVNRYGSVSAITDVDYPSAYTVTLTSLTRSSTTATAQTAADANFLVGDTVTIAGADQSDYNGAKVVTSVTPANEIAVPQIAITIARSGTTATATTVSEPHGFTNGQSVVISGAFQSEYNGTKTITWISATSFSFTVTVSAGTEPTSPAGGSPAIGARVGLYGTLVTNATNVATSTTTFTLNVGSVNGLANGNTVHLEGSLANSAGPALSIAGDYVLANVTSYTSEVTIASGGSGIQNGTLTISKVISPASVSSITFSAVTGLATVTTSGAHGLATGNVVTLTGATPTAYNTTSGVTVLTSTTFTYFIVFTPESPATPATGTITAKASVAATGFQFTFEVSGSPVTPATGTITAALAKYTVPGIVYFDGYFLVMDENGVVYNSAEDDPRTWEPLEYLIAQTETGEGKAIARTVNYVVCFKEWSTEFLWNAANEPPGSPFSPVPNSATLIGCADGWSVAEVAGNLMWIGQGKKVAGRGVYLMSGTQPQKVSTPDVDRVIAADSLAEVYAYGVELDGHPCYVLTLGTTDVTLVYDLVSQEWTQWSSLTAGSSKSITSITLSGTTATVTFGVAHTLNDGDPVLIAGANQAAYNGIHQVAYVSTTVVTIEVAAGTTTPATGTITGTPYTESCFKMVKYANCAGVNTFLHESDGYLYTASSSLYRDAGIPINLFARSERLDGGDQKRKKASRLGIVGDYAADTLMVRYSDDDSTTFSAYRRVTLSDREPNIRRLGGFERRSFELRHIGNTAPVLEAMELEVSR